MTLSQSLNRTFNLLAVSIAGLAGFAFASEIFMEKDWDDKGDDIAMLLFGIFGIIWYLQGENRFRRSVVPYAVVFLSFVAKVIGLVIEFHDPEAAGDDFGGVTLFLLSTLLVTFLYFKTKKMLRAASEPSVPT